MRLIIAILAAVLLPACASLDAAHIKGQEQDAAKYSTYSDVELQKQVNVETCFNQAKSDAQMAMCALMGTATGMASTFGGRPTPTAIAPTTGENIRGAIKDVAPYAAGAIIGRGLTRVQAKDPVIVEQPAPLVVRPEVVNPLIVRP
jgi:hypothetical protein